MDTRIVPPAALTIGITGVTGFLGCAVAQLAHEQGHRVIGFSRSPAKCDKLPGCHEVRLFAPEDRSKPPDLSGIDAVIHLAGESVFGLWTRAKRRRILESRREGTRALAQAIGRQMVPPALISASGAGYYGETGDEAVDESSPASRDEHDFLALVCRVWEQEALRAEAAGARVAIVRLGIVLGEQGGMLARVRPIFRLGLGGRLGSGEQWVSWIAVEDAARLIMEITQHKTARGIFNGVSPEPLRNRDFTRALAARWHRPAPFAVPAFVLKAALGDLSNLMLMGQRVLPRRTLALPFAFRYPRL